MEETISRLFAWVHAVLPLLVAWGLDRWLGDPTWWPHPVVGFGRLIAFGEKRWNRGKGRLFKGIGLTLVLVGGVYGISSWLLGMMNADMPMVTGVLETGLIFSCLAGTTLVREVREVFRALDRSLEAGRQQVSRIVGRNTEQLSAQEVRTAALETLAENLSDGVIAPLFWYLLLGVPGMLAYKMVNTLDSMIGYRNERYLHFGAFAARLDDVANFIPARLTAVLMLIVSGRLELFAFVRMYGRQHLSPNSGYPEAALAGILNCRFGGPHNYFHQEVWKPYIGENPRLLTTADLSLALSVNRRTETLMIGLMLMMFMWRM